MMKNNNKTKEQFLKEVEKLKRRITELEKSETDRKKAEKEIEKEKNRFNLLFEKSPIAFAILHPQKGFLDVNDATLKLFGCKSKEQMLSLAPDKFSPEYQFNNELTVDRLKRNWTEIRKKRHMTFDWIHNDLSGREFVTKVTFNLIELDGEKVLQTAIQDISKEREAKQELNEKNNKYLSLNKEYQLQNKELKKAKEKAEESDRLKTEFLANMSHEIRTPLNAILGFSRMIEMPNLTVEKRKHYINIIQNGGNQLLSIIEDILEISRLETKQVIPLIEEVCLNDLLLELFSIFDIKAKENKIPLYFKNGYTDSESTILTDDTMLNKIISKLLENALKFTNAGFIEFGYKLAKTHSRLSQQVKSSSTFIQIYVKDTGIGIKPEKREAIFERFSQEEKGMTKNIGGLGLGLSIAKENTELLGGEITVQSEKGEGATFYVTIPYKQINLNKEITDAGNDKR